MSGDSNRKCFVGNINYAASESDLRDLFSPYGGVAEVHLCMDHETGKPRGFGFVTLMDAAQVERAINALNGMNFLERKLVVDRAKERGR